MQNCSYRNKVRNPKDDSHVPVLATVLACDSDAEQAHLLCTVDWLRVQHHRSRRARPPMQQNLPHRCTTSYERLGGTTNDKASQAQREPLLLTCKAEFTYDWRTLCKQELELLYTHRLADAFVINRSANIGYTVSANLA